MKNFVFRIGFSISLWCNIKQQLLKVRNWLYGKTVVDTCLISESQTTNHRFYSRGFESLNHYRKSFLNISSMEDFSDNSWNLNLPSKIWRTRDENQIRDGFSEKQQLNFKSLMNFLCTVSLNSNLLWEIWRIREEIQIYSNFSSIYLPKIRFTWENSAFVLF